MSPPLTVLIATMNRRDLLELALWYIYETSTVEERDIWVWDNASTDDTADFLGTLQGWPGVRCFRSERGEGTLRSRLRMLRAVETPYVLSLDDDWWMLNAGWATGMTRVLGADPTIHQVSLGTTPLGGASDYGIGHTHLDRPFFRVPPILPGPKANVNAPSSRIAPPGTEIVERGGEVVVVPLQGSLLPFSCSGGGAVWRTTDIRSIDWSTFHPGDRVQRAEAAGILGRVAEIRGDGVEVAWDDHSKDVLSPSAIERPLVVDLREVWGDPLAARGTHEATIIGYGCAHPSPGPLWHLGRGERYWEERCRMAPAVYGRSGETQRAWLEKAREASGWGRSIEDADIMLPGLERAPARALRADVLLGIPVVILCGGRGLRLGERTETVPKPLVEVGGMPILWHVMRTYARGGYRRFILCLGYKGDAICAWFTEHRNAWEDWTVVFADTGLDAETGERVRRVEEIVSPPAQSEENGVFFVSYADGVSDVDVPDLFHWHRSHERIATMTCVRPATHYGIVDVGEDGRVTSYAEKPRLAERVNGGFFCFTKDVFEYIGKGEALEREPMQRLIAAGQLSAYVHDGFWHCLDTPKDCLELNAMWSRGETPWVR